MIVLDESTATNKTSARSTTSSAAAAATTTTSAQSTTAPIIIGLDATYNNNNNYNRDVAWGTTLQIDEPITKMTMIDHRGGNGVRVADGQQPMQRRRRNTSSMMEPIVLDASTGTTANNGNGPYYNKTSTIAFPANSSNRTNTTTKTTTTESVGNGTTEHDIRSNIAQHLQQQQHHHLVMNPTIGKQQYHTNSSQTYPRSSRIRQRPTTSSTIQGTRFEPKHHPITISDNNPFFSPPMHNAAPTNSSHYTTPYHHHYHHQQQHPPSNNQFYPYNGIPPSSGSIASKKSKSNTPDSISTPTILETFGFGIRSDEKSGDSGRSNNKDGNVFGRKRSSLPASFGRGEHPQTYHQDVKDKNHITNNPNYGYNQNNNDDHHGGSITITSTTAVSLARHAPYAGFLQKLGRQVQQYKRRFFLLQEPVSYLYYYLNEHDTVPRGYYNLQGVRIEYLPATIINESQSVRTSEGRRNEANEDVDNNESNNSDDEDSDDVGLNSNQLLGDIDISHPDLSEPTAEINPPPSVSNRFALIWDDTGERVILEARSIECAKEWVDMIESHQITLVQEKLGTVHDENTILQQRIEELEKECTTLQHIEQDRDGAIEDAYQWKQQFHILDTALQQLHNHIRTRKQQQESIVLPNTDSTTNNSSNRIKNNTDNDRNAVGNNEAKRRLSKEKDEVATQQPHQADTSNGYNDASQSNQRSTSEVNPVNRSLLDQAAIVDEKDLSNFGQAAPLFGAANSLEQDIEAITLSRVLTRDFVFKVPGENYHSLFTMIEELLNQWKISSEEASNLKSELQTTKQQLETLETKMGNAEKHLCEIWEENCSIRKLWKQTKREKRVLVREVKNLVASIQQQEHQLHQHQLQIQQQRQQHDQEQQQQQQQAQEQVQHLRASSRQKARANSNSRSNRGKNHRGNDDEQDVDNEHGQKLIDELEKHVLSSIRLNEKFLLAHNQLNIPIAGLRRRNRTVSPPQRRRGDNVVVNASAGGGGGSRSGDDGNDGGINIDSNNNHHWTTPQWKQNESKRNYDSTTPSELDTSIETAFDHDDKIFRNKQRGSTYSGTGTTILQTPAPMRRPLSRSGSLGIGSTGDSSSSCVTSVQSTDRPYISKRTSVASLLDASDDDDESDTTSQQGTDRMKPISNGNVDVNDNNVSDTESTTMISSIGAEPPSVAGTSYNDNADAKNDNENSPYGPDESDQDDIGQPAVTLEGNVIILNGEEITLNESKNDRYLRDRPNPLLKLDDDIDDTSKADDNRSATPQAGLLSSQSETSSVRSSTRTIKTNSNRATTKLTCPLADVVSTSANSEHPQEELQVYHLTFRTRKIGIQFMKVPPSPFQTKGLLTDALKSDLSTTFQSNGSELRRGNDANSKGYTESGADETCTIATPVDAVLVCGFHGFDDSDGQNVRPKLGAKLIAFDGVSVEVGKWTFQSIRKAIQARDRPLTLSFRNDYLTTEQRAMLTKAIATAPPPQPVRQQQTPVVQQQQQEAAPKEGRYEAVDTMHASSHESGSFVNDFRRNTIPVDGTNSHDEEQNHYDYRMKDNDDVYSVSVAGSGSEYSGSRYSSFLPTSFSGSKRLLQSSTSKDANKYGYYGSSFSDAGTTSTVTTTTSVLSSVVPTLMSNLLSRSSAHKSRYGGGSGSGIRSSRTTTKEPFTPEYLRRAPTAVEGTPQHQDFQSELL